jgi:hypothetical protein
MSYESVATASGALLLALERCTHATDAPWRGAGAPPCKGSDGGNVQWRGPQETLIRRLGQPIG